jgi:WD40 repeat protein
VSIVEFDGVPILLTASVDSTARLWDLDKLEPLGESLTGHDGSVDAVTLSASGSHALVFTGDNTGIIRAWDLATRVEVASAVPRLQKWVSCMASGRLYERPVMVIGGGDGTIRIWCHTSAKIVAEAQLNTTPQDVLVHPPGDICIATAMGIVSLHISNWMEESVP